MFCERCRKKGQRGHRFLQKNAIIILVSLLSIPVAIYFTNSYDALWVTQPVAPPVGISSVTIKVLNKNLINTKNRYVILEAVVQPEEVQNVHFNWTFGDRTTDKGGPVIGHNFSSNLSPQSLWVMVSASNDDTTFITTSKLNLTLNSFTLGHQTIILPGANVLQCSDHFIVISSDCPSPGQILSSHSIPPTTGCSALLRKVINSTKKEGSCLINTSMASAKEAFEWLSWEGPVPLWTYPPTGVQTTTPSSSGDQGDPPSNSVPLTVDLKQTMVIRGWEKNYPKIPQGALNVQVTPRVYLQPTMYMNIQLDKNITVYFEATIKGDLGLGLSSEVTTKGDNILNVEWKTEIWNQTYCSLYQCWVVIADVPFFYVPEFSLVSGFKIAFTEQVTIQTESTFDNTLQLQVTWQKNSISGNSQFSYHPTDTPPSITPTCSHPSTELYLIPKLKITFDSLVTISFGMGAPHLLLEDIFPSPRNYSGTIIHCQSCPKGEGYQAYSLGFLVTGEVGVGAGPPLSVNLLDIPLGLRNGICHESVCLCDGNK